MADFPHQETDPVAEADIATLRTKVETEEARAKGAEATKLPLAGGSLTGPLLLSADPTTGLGAATRQYVLAQIAGLINGAPEALDTLAELATALKAAEASDKSAVEALAEVVAGKLARVSNLGDLANVATARANLGLGSAALSSASAFDEAGAAAAVASRWRSLAVLTQSAPNGSETGAPKLYLLAGTTTAVIGLSGGGNIAPGALVPIFAADHAVAGKKTKLQVRSSVSAGNTPPEATFSMSLSPAHISGNNFSTTAEATQYAKAEIVPGENQLVVATSEIELPPDGWYLGGWSVNATTAGAAGLRMQLAVGNV